MGEPNLRPSQPVDDFVRSEHGYLLTTQARRVPGPTARSAPKILRARGRSARCTSFRWPSQWPVLPTRSRTSTVVYHRRSPVDSVEPAGSSVRRSTIAWGLCECVLGTSCFRHDASYTAAD